MKKPNVKAIIMDRKCKAETRYKDERLKKFRLKTTDVYNY